MVFFFSPFLMSERGGQAREQMRWNGFINISLGPCSQQLPPLVCQLAPSGVPVRLCVCARARVCLLVTVIGLQPTFWDDKSLSGKSSGPFAGFGRGPAGLAPPMLGEAPTPHFPTLQLGAVSVRCPPPCPGPC